MTTTPLPPKKPEALRIADELDCHNANLDRRARKELRRQHAEIEQLTQARADLEADIAHKDAYADQLGRELSKADAQCRALEAENKRLREALKRIESMCAAPPDFSDATIQDVARAALENRA